MFKLMYPLSAAKSALIAIAMLLVGTTIVAAQDGVDVIQNRWSPTQYLTVQSGEPQAGPVSPTAPEARWAVERTGDVSVIRLRNVATGLYLLVGGGQLRVGPEGSDQAAAWTLERVAGNPDARVRNVQTGGYLHTKDGPLMLGEASPEWQQSYWKFIPAGYAQQPALPPVPALDGCRAHFGKWLWIGGKYVCAKGCPPGFHAAGNACVQNCPVGSHSNGSFCVKNCPVGFHPVGNMCVKTCAPGFHPAGNVCVKNQPICPVGLHLSLGHCCPAGKNWNVGLKKCT